MAKQYMTIDNVSCVDYFSNFLTDEISKDVFLNIMKEAQFLSDEQSAIVMMGKKINIPRKQCGYGDIGTSYKFTGVKVEGKTWNDVRLVKPIQTYHFLLTIK